MPPPRHPQPQPQQQRQLLGAHCPAHHSEHAAPHDAAVVCAFRLPGLAVLAEPRPPGVSPIDVVVSMLQQVQLPRCRLQEDEQDRERGQEREAPSGPTAGSSFTQD
jgi:hypothetical protein